MPNAKLSAGRAYPLGSTYDGLGVNFAVFSANAEKIELCLFEKTGRREIARYELPECTDEVWHGYLPEARPGLVYGYRAYGAYEPTKGHRFNPHKLLLDPYARQLAGAIRWSDALFGYRLHSPRADLSFDRRDSAPAMVKAVVTDGVYIWDEHSRPDIPWRDTIIYEAHLRGMTKLRGEIRPDRRGTFAALCDPFVIEHLQKLGITSLELMPIHAFLQDRHLLAHGLRNYWGYNTFAFFAPEPAYLADGTLEEMRIAVQTLHNAGIEVILDVVYNHTAEGSELGPTLSFRGLDNASYYRLVEGQPRHCVNDTGTGNTVNMAHPRVLQMVTDSLRYWVTRYRIDGFRFDLGVTLGRESHGFDPAAGFFDAVRQDPVLSRIKLISEPWDVGTGGYQLGNHPPGFSEWNDKFRDGVRRFWRGDEGMRPEMAARLAGSGDLFDRRKRRPWASINYVTSHDGYTLADLTSYVERHNEANGEENNDGHQENFSANWGAEGPTDDPAILETRARVTRAMLATILLSQGTPMILAGDEFGRTQNGNNNAYCQDNELAWIDWRKADSETGRALMRYLARLIGIRRTYDVLRSDYFLHAREEPAPGIKDIAWFDDTGTVLSPEGWNNPSERTLSLRCAGRQQDDAVAILTVCFNPTDDDKEFRLPPPELPRRLLLVSSAPDEPERDLEDAKLSLPAHSVALIGSFVGPPP